MYDKINDKSIVVVVVLFFFQGGGGGDLMEGECKRQEIQYLPTGP